MFWYFLINLMCFVSFVVSSRPLFEGDNEFCLCLKESFPNLKTRKLTRVEWGTIRRLMGKPRRYATMFAFPASKHFHFDWSMLKSHSNHFLIFYAVSTLGFWLLQVFVCIFCWGENSTKSQETKNASVAAKKNVGRFKLQRPSWWNSSPTHHRNQSHW